MQLQPLYCQMTINPLAVRKFRHRFLFIVFISDWESDYGNAYILLKF
jgi:hypothetical protein